MTKDSLKPSQQRIVEMIDALTFGRIEGLTIRCGEPYYEPAPCIAQEIKLGTPPEDRRRSNSQDFALKSEFESLFIHLERLGNGIVDIEIRHGLPFRLIINHGDTGCLGRAEEARR